MKKNDVFTLTAPNGVEVTAVVLCVLEINQTGIDTFDYKYLCYGQNRLFTCYNMITDYTEDLSPASPEIVENYVHRESDVSNIRVCVDYAILPDYDELLKEHESMDYPLWEQNMEKPDPDEGEDIFWDSCAEEHNKQEDV